MLASFTRNWGICNKCPESYEKFPYIYAEGTSLKQQVRVSVVAKTRRADLSKNLSIDYFANFLVKYPCFSVSRYCLYIFLVLPNQLTLLCVSLCNISLFNCYNHHRSYSIPLPWYIFSVNLHITYTFVGFIIPCI